MKVPNKVLQIINKSFTLDEQPTSDERKLVSAWAQEGLAKRETLALESKIGSVAQED